MPAKRLKPCQCGLCTESTQGDFAPGHDQKLRIHLEKAAGGLLQLKNLLASVQAPEHVINRQLVAYNARDLDAWFGTYASDAIQKTLSGEVLAKGHAALRARMKARMADPALHAKLLKRSVMGQVVVDHEVVSETGPNGIEHVEMVCVYLVEDGVIRSATFHREVAI